MKRIVILILSLIGISSLDASELVKTIEQQERRTSIVPVGMGVMQICFTPFSHDQKIDVITETIRRLLEKTKDNQKAIINTALIYGMKKGDAEKLLSEALMKLTPTERHSLIVVTWVGLDGIEIEEETSDHELIGPTSMYTKGNTYDQFMHESFVNLQIDQLPEIELWVGLHRLDTQAPLPSQIHQLKILYDHPRVIKVGLSEVPLSFVRECGYTVKIGFLETELSLSRQFVLQDGILEYCKNNDIVFLAYSPLDRGIWTPKVDKLDDWLALGQQHPFLNQLPGWNNEEIVLGNFKERAKAIDIANKLAISINNLALAWIMKKGGIPLPDSTNVERSASNFSALHHNLPDEHMEVLDNLSFAGKRYK